MIVHCNFEELTALKAGARHILDEDAPEQGMVAAPPAATRRRRRRRCPAGRRRTPATPRRERFSAPSPRATSRRVERRFNPS